MKRIRTYLPKDAKYEVEEAQQQVGNALCWLKNHIANGAPKGEFVKFEKNLVEAYYSTRLIRYMVMTYRSVGISRKNINAIEEFLIAMSSSVIVVNEQLVAEYVPLIDRYMSVIKFDPEHPQLPYPLAA